MAFTIITETIGTALGTEPYANVSAWLAAHNGEDLVFTKIRYIGQITGDLEISTGSIIVPSVGGGGCVTDAEQYRELSVYPTFGRYQPHKHTGPRFYGQWLAGSGAETLIDIQEDHFHMNGFGVICEDPNRTTGTGGNVKVGIKIDADGVRAFSVMVKIAEGGTFDVGIGNDPFFYCYWIGSTGADDVDFWNCLALGSIFHKGANFGWFFDSFSTGGGVYNCEVANVTHGLGRGFVGHLSGTTEPEIINCISAGCSDQDILGLWATYTHLISSDESADAIVGTVEPDPDSFSYQSRRSLWVAHEAQDLRNRQASVARASGLDLSVEMADSIGGSAQDWFGASTQRTAGSWSIGAFEGFASPAIDPPDIITKTIKAGGDYATIQAFLTDGEDRSLVFLNRVLIGEVYDEGERDLGSGRIVARRVLTDATRYREVRSAERANRYDPVHDSGVRVTSALSAASFGLFDIDESFFRLSGIRLENTRDGPYAQSIVRISGPWARVDAVAAIHSVGVDIVVRTGFRVVGSHALVTNCIAKGAGDSTNGLTRGFVVAECSFSRIIHSIADEIDGVSGVGFGFEESTRVDRVEFINCISTSSGTSDFSHPAGRSFITQANNISSDATADGPGAQKSVARSTIWVDPDDGLVGDFRLVVTSPAIKAGRNMRFRMDADWNGDPRFAPFDLGIYEGFAAAPFVGAAPWRDDLARGCYLWSIFRTDGGALFFTDANEPLPYGGRVFEPVGSVNAGSIRGGAGLKERSLSILGAITSDKITTADLVAGRYRFARVEARIINWRDLFAAPFHTEVFWIADLEFDAEVWKADPVGIAQRLEEARGGVASTGCPYRLGDDDCRKDVSAETIDDVGVVTIARPFREFDADATDIPFLADDFYKWAEIEWLSGANTGLQSEVKKFTGSSRRIVLVHDLPFAITTLDTFHLRPGCGGRYIEDCIGLYSHGKFFGGDPFIPGPEAAWQTAQV